MEGSKAERGMMGKVTYASDGRHGNVSHNPPRLISQWRKEKSGRSQAIASSRRLGGSVVRQSCLYVGFFTITIVTAPPCSPSGSSTANCCSFSCSRVGNSPPESSPLAEPGRTQTPPFSAAPSHVDAHWQKSHRLTTLAPPRCD